MSAVTERPTAAIGNRSDIDNPTPGGRTHSHNNQCQLLASCPVEVERDATFSDNLPACPFPHSHSGG